MQRNQKDNPQTAYYSVEKNQEIVLKLFRSYYRAHQTSGKLLDDFPEFFLAKPEIFNNPELVERASDKLILNDCVGRALARKGYVGISKLRNPKLNYYWLELTVFPYMLGDDVTQNNQGEFFFLVSKFVEFTKQNPNVYGDLTAEVKSDKDIALMLEEINKRSSKLPELMEHYPLEMLIKFNPKWPVSEVNKLMQALKVSDQSWCELFYEYVMYVMGKKQ
ncbi:MAG: hypothetical protein HOO97_05245 [Sideroxydans sp.]|nr:hypothetical protein [Sideroxydans sp.]NOT98482.1 hypothetical protein [Sideroxydans sp.]